MRKTPRFCRLIFTPTLSGLGWRVQALLFSENRSGPLRAMAGFAQRHVQRQAVQVVGYRVQRRVLLQERIFR